MKDLEKVKAELKKMSVHERICVSAKTGLSVSTITKIMNGHTDNPGIKTIELILKTISK